MENIHPVLYAIINLHLKAETVESLSPEMLDNIGKFMEWVVAIFVTPLNEQPASPGLCTRYILSLKDNRMGTGSSICSAIMKCRNCSGIVMQDWTRLWKFLRCVIYLYILARH
jgi:hypothetical protein